jgi:predicted metal-dependent hydrolase
MSNEERHEIPVRKVHLPFDENIPRHWFGDNAVQTHIFNGLNLVFPDGERFFVRAVMDHADRIHDPELRAQIKGFVGQEGWHAHEHERYFATMREQGYRIDGFLDRFRKFAQWTNKYLPGSFRLAVTAGAEHYTATLGVFALTGGRLPEAHPVMRQLITWHAVEEIEHKAVAFDVLRAVNPSYALRIAGFLFATVALAGWTVSALRMLLRQDGIDKAEAKAMLLELERRDRGRMRRALRDGFRAYFRRDFHPSDVDDMEIARAQLAEIAALA